MWKRRSAILSVALWDAGGQGMAAFGTGADRHGPPQLARLAVRPGFRTPGITYSVTDLRLRVNRPGRDLAWGLQREGSGLAVPDPAHSLYAPANGRSQAVYVQEMEVDYTRAPDVIVGALSEEPDNVEFECTVALVSPAGREGPAVAFRLRGGVGYVRRTDASGYSFDPYVYTVSPAASDGPRVSVGLPESD